MAQTVKITPASGLLEFIGNTTSNKPYLQHDDNGNLTLTLQATKKFTVAGNLKVNGKVTMAQQTLTDGAAITWDFNSGANAKVTIAGARTLVISNMETGDTGLILVKQDAVGGRTLSLPSGSSIVGGGSYTASSAANATDVLGVYYDGTTYWWTIGYNTVTPPLTSVGITGSDFTISNSPLTSNGTIGLALATVNSNVGTFGSATAVPVVTVNAKGLVTAVSATNISIPTNLDSLTDVTISSAATGQLLQFNGSQWVNWTPNYLTGITSLQVTTALGYTPVPNTRNLTINGVTQNLTADRTWTIDTVNYVSRVQHGVKAGVAINKGQAVYVTSANGTNMIVGLASNTSEATSSKTMGLLDATVATNGFANVVTEGLLTDVDTSLAGTEGDPVWLGANGNLIFGLANKPYAPNHLVFIGIVTRKNANTGEIFVKVQNGFELREIHDVDLITTVPVNGEILGYNGTLWVNKTIAGWLGFTPANDANVVHTSGNETISGIKTFSGTTQATSTSTGTIVTSGGVGIAKNLYVGGNINVVGNLIIGGTTTTVNAQNLSVSDNMIYLNNGIQTTITNAVGNGSTVVYTTEETHNYIAGMSVTITGVSPTAYNLSNQTITAVGTNSFTIANSATGSYSSGGTARAKSNANPDLGFAAGYNDGSYAHAGLFRDATDGIWKFFKGYTPEPDASAFIDTSHASFTLANLQAYDITGNSFIKSGGTSSQFLKADGSVDSSTYLTTGTASSTYQPLDADLTAIAALATTGFLKRTGSNTWSLDSNTYLTSYTETSTLAQVTARGATTSVATSFTGGASISSLTLNGATAIAESSLKLGAHGTDEGGQLSLEKATSYTYAAHIDIWQDSLRILYGTNAVTTGVALRVDLSNRQLILPSYTTSSSFSGTAVGWLAFDASGKVITVAAPTGAVTSVNAGTGVSVNSTTGAVTVSIGQSVATSASPTFNQVLTTSNGGGTNVKLGDDVWIGDVNSANTMGIVGQQNSDRAFITFGSDLTLSLGRISTGALTWGGNTIYHAGNLTNLNQLTNGPGYITGYTEIDTLATVTGRGATTSIASSFTGGATITGLTVAKSGTDSTITFPAQSNDPGYIKHYESVNTAIMYFNVSDDSNDFFHFGYTGNTGAFQLRSDGVVTVGTWQGTAIADSYISSAATWNAKQAALSGSGIVKSASGTISYISGTSAQFIKGDGSLDSNTYLTTGTASSTYLTISTAASTYLPLGGGTLTGTVTFPSAYNRRPQFPGGILGLPAGDGNFDIWGISTEYYPSHPTPQNAWGLRWNGDNNDFEFVGAGTSRVILDMDGGNITSTGSITGTSFVKSGGTSSQFLKADGSVDSSTYATQGYVTTAVSNLVASAPAALDTLNELAAALGNDASFSTTVSTALGNRLRVDINTQGLTSTQKGYGRTNLGVVIGTDVQAWDGDLDAIAALSGTSGFLKKTAANTWSLDTSTYLTSYTETDTLATVTGRGATTNTAVTFNSNVTLGNNADLVFRDLSGTFPTTGKGFDWELNNDGARIYAIQPSSDSIDLVFQLRDNATTNDRFVFHVDDYQGPAFDKYPLIIRGGTEFDLVSSDLYIGGTRVLSNARVLSNISGNISMFTNNSGYITGITSGNVTTALGYTPVTNARTLTINGTAYDLSANRSWTVGDLLSSGSYANPSWITSLAWSKITGAPAAQTLSLSGSTLSISGGNSVTLPTGGISQATADDLYVNVSGDVMTGSLYIFPISDNPAQFQLAGSNPELYVSAKTGTARVFINRQASGNQATLMFTTGMTSYQGTAWDYSGAPMWSMGMTNNNNTDSFKLGYGDIYDPLSVSLEITSAQVAYFKYVPYAAGNLLATQSWVQSQGYLTSVSDVWVNTSGDTMTGALTINTTGSAGNAALRINNSTSSTFVHTQENLAANLTAGQHNILVVGKAGNTKNSGYIGYYWAGNASDSNFVTIGHWGNDDLLRVYGNGLVTIGSNTVWHAGNDGAGSGLDADLLDGYNSDTAANVNTIVRRDSSGNIYSNYVLGTYFNASAGNSSNPTIGQIWTQDIYDNYLRKSTPSHFRSQITDGYYLSLGGGTVSGNVNLTGQLGFLDGNGGYSNIIRSAAYPSEGYPDGTNYWLEYRSWGGHHFVLNVDGGAGSSLFSADDFVIWQGAIDGDRLLELSNTGTLTIADRLIELSSIRYKTQVESLTPALDKVMQLRPVTYYKIGVEDKKEIGLIAEEVESIYPELIKYDDTGQVDGINYTRIAPILIKTIQEQQELIKKLTERIENLENR